MQILVALAVFSLAQLALFAVYTSALTADPFLSGWLAVVFHGFTLAIMMLAGAWFSRSLRS